MRVIAVASTALMMALALAFALDAPRAEGQGPPPAPPEYEYEVLPGIQPGYDPATGTIKHDRNLALSCGWHTDACYQYTLKTTPHSPVSDGEGIDIILPNSSTPAVYAAFRALKHGSSFSARVAHTIQSPTAPTGGYGSCRKVVIEVLDGNNNRVGEISYTHVVSTLQFHAPVDFPSPATGTVSVDRYVERLAWVRDRGWLRYLLG